MSGRDQQRRPLVLPIARAALARGPLEPDGACFRFGRRKFSSVTINLLIADGEATRLADGRVVATATAGGGQ